MSLNSRYTRNKKLLKAEDKYGLENPLIEINSNWDIIDQELSKLDSLEDLDLEVLSSYESEVSSIKRRVVNTIADLKKSPLSIGDYVKTLGYNVIGDSCGAEYIIKATTEVEDGGFVFNLDNGLQAHLLSDTTNGVSVKWFGAKGDRTVDDSKAIQLAMNACSTRNLYPLIVPAGGYRLDTLPLIFNGNSSFNTKKIVCDGYLQANASQGEKEILVLNSSGVVQLNIQVVGVSKWKAGVKPSNLEGIKVTTSAVIFERTRINGCKTGVNLNNNGGHIHFIDCDIGNNWVGVDISRGTGDYYFKGGQINGNTYCNLRLSSKTDTNYSSMSFENIHFGFSPYGILQPYLSTNGTKGGMFAVNFSQCQFESIGNAAIWFPDGSDTGELLFRNCGYGWDWSGSQLTYTMKPEDYPNSGNPEADDFNPATPKQILINCYNLSGSLDFDGRLNIAQQTSGGKLLTYKTNSSNGVFLPKISNYSLIEDSIFLDNRKYTIKFKNNRLTGGINTTSTQTREFIVRNSTIKSWMRLCNFRITTSNLNGIPSSNISINVKIDKSGGKFTQSVRDGEYTVIISFEGDTGQSIEGWLNFDFDVTT